MTDAPEDKLAQISQTINVQPIRKGVRELNILTVDDARNRPRRDYLIKGLISPGDLSVWYGPPACGKTFLTMHLAYAIAQGREIFSRRVKQAPVLYIGLEGENGVFDRAKALEETFGETTNFCFTVEGIDLLSPDGQNADDINAIVAAVETTGAKLVIIDTLNRALGGADENDSRGMGGAIKACKDIIARTGCHLAVVHHSGKAGTDNGPRGHSSLEGAADVVVAITGDDIRTATTRKVKDGEVTSMSFSLNTVELGIDDDGDTITSCAVEETETPAAVSTRLKGDEPGWYSDLCEIFATPGLPQPRNVDGRTLHVTLTRDQVNDGLLQRGRIGNGCNENCNDESNTAISGADRTRVSRYLNRLRDKGKIGLSDKIVWMVS